MSVNTIYLKSLEVPDEPAKPLAVAKPATIKQLGLGTIIAGVFFGNLLAAIVLAVGYALLRAGGM